MEFRRDYSPWDQGSGGNHKLSAIFDPWLQSGQTNTNNSITLFSLIPNNLRNGAHYLSSDSASHTYQQVQMRRLLNKIITKCDLSVARATTKDSRPAAQGNVFLGIPRSLPDYETTEPWTYPLKTFCIWRRFQARYARSSQGHTLFVTIDT
jgi:hypothetical protein